LSVSVSERWFACFARYEVCLSRISLCVNNSPRSSGGIRGHGSVRLDKLFWVAIRQFWSQWKKNLIVVTPETVVRWHQAGF
jgi:hypothetical protein